MQTHSDWLKQRQKGLGGSDVAAVLWPYLPESLTATEHPPFKNAVEIWLSKTGQVEEEAGSDAMQDGNELEPIVLKHLLKNTRRDGIQLIDVLEHPDTIFKELTADDGTVVPCIANLDGLAADRDGPVGLELKTGGTWATELWKEDIPFIYYCQVQWYMGVVGLPRFYVQMWFYGRPKPYYRVDFNPEFFGLLLNVSTKFWRDYVVPGVVPPVTADSGDVLKTLYPGGDGNVIEIEDIDLDENETVPADILITEYLDLCAQLDKMGKRKAELENRLKVQMGNAENALTPGYVLKWGSYERKTVDLDGLRAAHPEMVAEFTTTVRQRRWNKPKVRK